MSNRPDWDDQFRETEYERQERWRRTRARRTAEGKCWQCAKPVAECGCGIVHRMNRTQTES